jgi:hypothetical protein
MKYALYAFLFLFLASCAPKPAVAPGKSAPPSKAYMEERFKSKDAVDKVAIGGTGTALYYDRRRWSVKTDVGSRIEFNARRFTNARIFAYDETIPMTEIYRKLVEEYGLKDARLVESEFVRVNGQAVVFNKIEGKHGRKPLVILSYGYSDEGRTVIPHAHIYKGMLRDETEREIVDFLNGFVVGG